MHKVEDVNAIIEKSGNSFHCRVLNYFEEKGWTVLISPYYNDNVSGKPREIDLIVEKAVPVRDSFNGFLGNIHIKLFVECKYISKNTVFWFHDKDGDKALALVTRQTPLREGNAYTEKHHYISKKIVAKLFAEGGGKPPDNEVFFKALGQSLNAMIAYRNTGTIIPDDKARSYHNKLTLHYPVIMCNCFDKLYHVAIKSEAVPTRITSNFMLEVNYAYFDPTGKSRNEYFLIDVVDFKLIEKYIEDITNDARLAGTFLRS